MSIVVAAVARAFKYNGMTLPDIPGIAVTMLGILLVQRARVRAAGAPPSG